MKPRALLVVLVLTLWVVTALVGCAAPAATSPSSTQTREPRAALDSTAPLPAASIVATSFIDGLNGWAVGGELEDGVGSLVQRTTDGGLTWKVLYADGAGFPLRDVVFTDALHGWAVSSSGTLVGSIIATVDGGGKHWVVQLRDGDHGSPLVGVSFVDERYGWAIASTGTLAGCIIASDDARRSWHPQGSDYGPLETVIFTDALHGTIGRR